MSLAQYALFWVVCLTLFLVPGALLARRFALLWSRLGHGEKLLPAFLLSAAIYGLAYLVALALRPTLTFAIAVWSAILLALLIWNLAAGGRDRRAAQRDGTSRQEAPGGRYSWLWSLPVLLFGWVAMLANGGRLEFVHDSLDFAAYVNRIVLTDAIDITSGAFAQSAEMPADPRRGAFHLAAAVLCRVSGASATEMWRAFPSFLVPLALWTFYASFRRLLSSAPAALAALVFFAAATFCSGQYFMNNLAYASRLGWVYSWIGLWGVALFLDAPRPQRRAALVLAIGCAPILVGIHVLSAAQYLVWLGAFCWTWALSRVETPSKRQTLTLLPVAALLALLPFLALKVARSYSVANPLFDHPQGLLYLTDNWVAMEPLLLMRWFSGLGMLGILLAIPLLWSFRRSRARAFLVGSTLVPFLILFNPLAMRAIEAVHGHSLVYRLMLVVPYFQVLGWMSVWAGRKLFGGSRKRSPSIVGRSVRFVAPLLLLLVLAGLLVDRVRECPHTRSFYDESRAGSREMPALNAALVFLDREIPQPQVVLSDPVTSYALPAYSHHYAMTSFGQHTSPSDPRTLERIRDSQAVLNAFVPLDETLSLLRKYSAGYILLNQSFTGGETHFTTVFSPSTYPAQLEKFARYPDIFERIYDRDKVLVFRFHDPGETTPGLEEPPNPFVVLKSEDAENTTREGLALGLGVDLYEGSSVGGVELLGVSLDTTAVVARGSLLEVTTYWRRTHEPIRLPVVAFVRLETTFPNRHFEGPLYGRVYRKWYERSHEATFRFGREQGPLASEFPAFLWETGAVYHAPLFVRIPLHAQWGRYTVRIKLVETAAAPNLRLGDLFTLHDSLDGPVVGHIRIR